MLHHPLLQHVAHLFHQLEDLLAQLNDQQYSQTSPVLNGSSIGQHYRHLIECFIELVQGYETGVVNYDKRPRQTAMEMNRSVASEYLQQMLHELHREDRPLHLEVSYGLHKDPVICLPSTYFRELVQNIEHTVHHMALIRMAVQQEPSVSLPPSFGLASSTQRAQLSCAQ